MGKKFRIIMLAMLTVCMVASMAFAGTNTVNNGAAATNVLIAREATGSARSLQVAGFAASNGAIRYVPGQQLTSANLLQVTLVNATFDTSPVYVCTAQDTIYGAGSNLILGTATPGAVSTYNFQLNIPTAVIVANGDNVYLSSKICTIAADAAVNRILNFRTTASPTGNGTIKVDAITAGGLAVDSSTAVTLYSILSEYATAQGATTHTIDYLQAPANGTRIINTGTTLATVADSSVATATSNSIAINMPFTLNYSTNGATGASNAGLTVGAVVNLTDSAAWQGVSNVYLTNGGVACTTGAANVINSAPSGTVALTIPANAFNGLVQKAFNLCVTPNGTSALSTRVIQSSVDVGVTGTGAVDPAASALANAQTWGLNAYQATVTWVINSATGPTYCLVNNTDTTNTATVLLDVVASEPAATISNATLGTLAAKTSKLVTFTADSATLAGGTAVSTSTMTANGRYSPRLTVTVNPQSATIACIQTDPITGAKRPVPVLTGDGANMPWKN